MLRKHLSSYLLVVYTSFSLICLIWSADPVIRALKRAFFYLLSPTTVPLMSEVDQWTGFGENVSRLLNLDERYRRLEDFSRRDHLDRKRFDELEAENRRLTELLQLTPHPRYEGVAARVLSPDVNDLFHSFLINKGREHGLAVSDPVVALENGQEVLVGRLLEIYARTAQVLLLTDSLSAVSAEIRRTKEQGVVEGDGNNRLIMNYLFSDSDVHVGDEILTAGLGDIFPAGVYVGTVEAVEEQSREKFKTAYVKPAVRLDKRREVLVLRRVAPVEAPAAISPEARP